MSEDVVREQVGLKVADEQPAERYRHPSFSAMMPEPTTVATRSPVPSASAAMRRAAVPSRTVQSLRPGNGSSSAVEPSTRPMSRKRCPNVI